MSISEILKSDPKLTEDEAAEFLKIKPQTLAVWRCNRRQNLPYLKIGRLIRYRLADLMKFQEVNTVGGPAAPTV
jgi:hypothetical protein